MAEEDLKLNIQIVKATNLPNVEKKRDASDPYVKLTFKSKSCKSDTIDNTKNPEWNEAHDIEVGSSPLLPGDVLEAVVKDHENIGKDRTLAQGKIPLKDCLTNPKVEIKHALLDANNKKLDDCFLFLTVCYNGAKKKSGGGEGASGAAGGATGAEGGAEGEGEPDGGEGGVEGDFAEPIAVVDTGSSNAGAMPDEGPPKTVQTKESLRGTLPKKPMDFQVRIKVWEARQLKGGGLKPVVKLKVAGQSKSSKVKASENPFWGETFFFNFNQIPIELFDEIINFQVCNSKKLRSDAIIGSFKLDIGSVWDDNRHSILSKWLMLTDPNSDSGELMGYLKVSAMVLGAGDEAPPDNQSDDSDDVESNLLRPAGTQLRPATFWIRLYHGEDIPQMDTGSFTAIKSFFSGADKDEEMKKQVDPFVIVKFAGKRVKSSVKCTTNAPEFNEQLQLKFNFPSMCQKIKFDLRDWDQLSGDDPISMGEIELSTISVLGDQGFLPTFGPCWLNFYGAPREEGKEALGGENESLNLGKGEGCAYRGRIMMEMGTVLDKKPEFAVAPVEESQLLTIGKFSRTRKWRLFAMFEEVNLITDELNEAIHFEVSVGNFGNSMDPDSSPMPSTTPCCQSVSDGQHYHYIPIGENKPIISVDCDFEDISFRLAIVNMLDKLEKETHEQAEALKAENERIEAMSAEEKDDRVIGGRALMAIQMLNFLKNNLPRVIATIESMQNQGNSLDKNMNQFRCAQLTSILARAQELYDSATEVQAVLDLVDEFLTIARNLAMEPQISIPDIIVWLMEDNTRVAYIRVPVKDVYYHKEREFRGLFCSKVQNLILKYPGKKQKKEYKSPAQIRIKLWFGLQVDETAFGSRTDSSLTTVAETFEYENFRVFWCKEDPNFSNVNGKVQYQSNIGIGGWRKSSPEFADIARIVEMKKEQFEPPPGWEFEGDWYISRDKSSEVEADEGLDSFTEDVFESQGRYPGLAWQDTPDKIQWVTSQSREHTPRDEIVPPPGWAWESEHHVWEVDYERAVDEQGFEYCVDIDLGGWQPSEKPFHVWRRRRWVRPRIKMADTSELQSLRAAPSKEEEDEGWEYGKSYSGKFHKVEQKMDVKRRRRWLRNLVRTDQRAPPLFFFEFEKKKNEVVKIAPRTFASFAQGHKYQMRAYIYQARDLLSADDEGYSDPYCRVVIGNRSQKTIVQKTTVNPTWNQTLIFKNVTFYDNPEYLAEQPPPVVIEVFDWDHIGSDDFLGRVVVKPVVKIVPTQGKKAELDWHPVTYFGEAAGEILCACELLLADPGVDLPFEPTRSETNKDLFIVPQGVAPMQQRTAIEILCWGVRNLKKYHLMSVDKPEMEFEIGNFRKKSSGVNNIKLCPNFKNPILFYELMLPVQEKYTPPMNIKVRDHRQFGRKPVVANHRVKSLSAYRIKPIELQKLHDDEIVDADVMLPPPLMGQARISSKASSKAGSEVNLAILSGVERPQTPEDELLSDSDVRIAVEDAGMATPQSQDDGASSATACTNLLGGLGTFSSRRQSFTAGPPAAMSPGFKLCFDNPAFEMKDEFTSAEKQTREVPAQSKTSSLMDMVFKNGSGRLANMRKLVGVGGGSRPKLPEAKPIKDDTLDWWTKFYASCSDEKTKEKAKDYLDASGDTIQILDCELEEVKGLDNLNDFLKTFTLDQGKKSTEEEGDYMGEFKGALVVYPLPSDRSAPQPKKYFNQIPSGESKEVVVRIYFIKATGLQPMDDNGKADPFIRIECGKTEIEDKENYIPNTLDPVFGRFFELTATLPVDKDLKISVWDWDMVGSNDLIGETVIDLEDRYLSKHRALCGIPKSYKISGLNAWRDCQTPKEILAWYCKRNNIDDPVWNTNTEVIVDKCRYSLRQFEATEPEPIEEYGPPDERLALHVLNQLDVVKEHIERRSLCAPTQPGVDQGQIYMWVDMFPKELGAPAPAVDITPRKAKKYFLRVCVYNTYDTVMDETSITGDTMSDVYVKGWLEGMEHDKQKTDVHYRCMDGNGMFNWRFVFEFNYDPSEKQIVVKRKEHFWSLDETESFYPARLNLQIWDNDLILADDFLGSLTLDLEKMCHPSKSRKACSLDQLAFSPPDQGGNKPVSLFVYRRFKGLWPLKRDLGDGEGPKLTGKLEMEIELCDEDEHAEKACGKARDEPNANPVLEPPNRPATSFPWFLSPWATFKHIIWKHYKWHIIIAILIILFVLFMALFIYTFPQNFMAAVMQAFV